MKKYKLIVLKSFEVDFTKTIEFEAENDKEAKAKYRSMEGEIEDQDPEGRDLRGFSQDGSGFVTFTFLQDEEDKPVLS